MNEDAIDDSDVLFGISSSNRKNLVFTLTCEFFLKDYDVDFKKKHNLLRNTQSYWIGIKKSDIVGIEFPQTTLGTHVLEAQEKTNEYKKLIQSFLHWDKWMKKLQLTYEPPPGTPPDSEQDTSSTNNISPLSSEQVTSSPKSTSYYNDDSMKYEFFRNQLFDPKESNEIILTNGDQRLFLVEDFSKNKFLSSVQEFNDESIVAISHQNFKKLLKSYANSEFCKVLKQKKLILFEDFRESLRTIACTLEEYQHNPPNMEGFFNYSKNAFKELFPIHNLIDAEPFDTEIYVQEENESESRKSERMELDETNHVEFKFNEESKKYELIFDHTYNSLAVEKVIKFLYSDVCEFTEKTTEEEVKTLRTTAKRLGIQRLVQICDIFLKQGRRLDPPVWFENMKWAWNNRDSPESLSDYEIICVPNEENQRETVPCLHALLKSGSDFFQAQADLQGDSSQHSQVLGGVSGCQVERLLKFIYCNELPNIPEEYWQTYVNADFFSFERMKIELKNLIMQNFEFAETTFNSTAQELQVNQGKAYEEILEKINQELKKKVEKQSEKSEKVASSSSSSVNAPPFDLKKFLVDALGEIQDIEQYVNAFQTAECDTAAAVRNLDDDQLADIEARTKDFHISTTRRKKLKEASMNI